MQRNVLDNLLHLTRTDSVRTLSGVPKKLFRYALTATFLNIVKGKHMQYGQLGNMYLAQDILDNPKEAPRKYDQKLIAQQVHQSLEIGFFHNPNDFQTVINVNIFFREKLEALKNGKRFWKAEEFEWIFSVKNFFRDSFGPIKDHHWIDFNIQLGLIPTFPDFITYSDLIHSWNLLIERRDQYNALYKDVNDIMDSFEMRKNLKAREIEYEIFSLQRLGYTACITFFESYLYYLYYNFKSQKVFNDDADVKRIYEMNNKNVNDTHILDKIIIPKFVSNERQFKEMNEYYEDYKKINDIRNAIIHTSAFEDRSNQSSYMELFYEVNIEKVELAYELVINFVLFIESVLPEEYKILFWWEKFEDPDFKSRKRLKIVNPNSNLSNLDFFQ